MFSESYFGGSFLTVSQVSEYLSVSSTIVYREIREGNLPSHKFAGKAIRVSKEDLDEYVKERRCEGTALRTNEPPKPKPASLVFKHLKVK